MVTLDLIALDNGLNNPLFGSLEINTENVEAGAKEGLKNIVFYELDLGLNHLVRKFSVDVPKSAYSIIGCPKTK